MKWRTHVLKRETIRPLPGVLQLFRPLKDPQTEILEIRPLRLDTDSIAIVTRTPAVQTEAPLTLSPQKTQEILIEKRFQLQLGTVKSPKMETPEIRREFRHTQPFKILAPGSPGTAIWWPLSSAPLPELTDALFEKIRQSHPLIQREHLALLKFYPGIPKNRITAMKFIQGELHAMFRMPFRGKMKLMDLLFVADRRVRKTHRIELPAGLLLRLSEKPSRT